MPDQIVAAHVQAITRKYTLHYPEHPARAKDPHYVDFEAFKRKTKATAQCSMGLHRGDFSECSLDQPLETHHAHIEFSLQNGVDLAWLERDYPGVSDPSQVGAWVESAANLLWLCCAEGTLVLLPDGASCAIEQLRVGDRVAGSDGLPHYVTATRSRRHRGYVCDIEGGPVLTPEHLVLTPEGWRPVASLAAHDLVYRFTEHPERVRSAAQVDVGEVHDSPSSVGEIAIPGLVVLNAVAMPLHPVDLNDHAVVSKHGVRHVAADGAEFLVRDAGRVERSEQPGLDSRGTVPDGTTFAVFVVAPHANARAVKTLVLRRRVNVSTERLPAGSAVSGAARLAGQRVKRCHAAGVGTILTGPRTLQVRARDTERLGAANTYEVQLATVAYSGTSNGGAIPRACGVAMRQMTDDQEVTTANNAPFNHPRPAGGRWSPVGDIRRRHGYLKVYDITVAGSHDFIADGMVVHNCAACHRGHGGVHVAAASDYEAEKYVRGLIT